MRLLTTFLVVAGFAAMTAPASAVVTTGVSFSGYTEGCFGPCNSNFSFGTNAQDQGLSFSGVGTPPFFIFPATAGFSGTTNNAGQLGVTLGSFDLSNMSANYNNNSFTLLVDFLNPASTSPNPGDITASLSGTVSRRQGGEVVVDFTSPATFTYNGGTFTLTVNDLDVFTGDPNLTGVIQVAAVPEASTWAMMIAGFLGIGLLAYRRNLGTLRLA